MAEQEQALTPRQIMEDKAYQIIDEARTHLGNYTAQDIRLAARRIVNWFHGEEAVLYGLPPVVPSTLDEDMRRSMIEAQYQADKARIEATAIEAELARVKAEAHRINADFDDAAAKHRARVESLTEGLHAYATANDLGPDFDDLLAEHGLARRAKKWMVPTVLEIEVEIEVTALDAMDAQTQVISMTDGERQTLAEGWPPPTFVKPRETRIGLARPKEV